jgi:hypothetical protein
VNQIFLKYSTSTTTASDATSITSNGLREVYIDSSSKITDPTTAGNTATWYISKNKDPVRKITVEINSKYDIESIRAGHFVTIQNLEYQIVSLQVKKLEYNMDKIKLELEDFYSI